MLFRSITGCHHFTIVPAKLTGLVRMQAHQLRTPDRKSLVREGEARGHVTMPRRTAQVLQEMIPLRTA